MSKKQIFTDEFTKIKVRIKEFNKCSLDNCTREYYEAIGFLTGAVRFEVISSKQFGQFYDELIKLYFKKTDGKTEIRINKEKYALVHTHNDIDIYTLKVAEPPKNSLGYIIDHYYFNEDYNLIDDAVKAIDLYCLEKQKLFRETQE